MLLVFMSYKLKKEKIWEHTDMKLKRQLKSSLKLTRIVFIGEPAFDAGCPMREFHFVLRCCSKKYYAGYQQFLPFVT